MTTFTCGCTEDGTERCPTHAMYGCHVDPYGWDKAWGNEPDCPPCRLARLRSVSLDGRATPTRRAGK